MRTLALSPLLLAAAITLAGCASTGGLHTDGTPTDTAALHGERSFAKIQTTPAAWPASDWWTKLGDVQLDALITEALKDNPDLASADARSLDAFCTKHKA